jgi:hypothetical protein
MVHGSRRLLQGEGPFDDGAQGPSIDDVVQGDQVCGVLRRDEHDEVLPDER